MICKNCSKDKEDTRARKSCRYCKPSHYYCDNCNIVIHAGLEDDETYMTCDYLQCDRHATHIDVPYAGEAYVACDEHYNLIGEWK